MYHNHPYPPDWWILGEELEAQREELHTNLQSVVTNLASLYDRACELDQVLNPQQAIALEVLFAEYGVPI